MTLSRASIPEKIIYVNYGKQNIYSTYKVENDSYYVEQNKCDVYSYVSESETQKLTARLNTGYYKPVSIDVLDNAPISGLQLDCTQSSQLKCLLFNKHNVPFTQFELLDIIKNNKLKVAGKISAEYIWVNVGSHLHLTGLNSGLHKEALKSIKRRSAKKIGKKSLVPGTIYETAAGKKYLFVDFVDVTKFMWGGYNNSDHSRKLIQTNKNKQIFSIELRSMPKERISSILSGQDMDVIKYKCKILNGHSFVTAAEVCKVPDDFIKNVREYYRNAMKQEFVDASQGKNHYSGYLNSQLVWNSLFFNLRKANEKIEEFNYKKYLAFT